MTVKTINMTRFPVEVLQAVECRPITVFFGMLSTDEVLYTGALNVNKWEFPEVTVSEDGQDDVALHPTEQADLGSKILIASMDEDQVVFTNSPLLILRLLRLVREGKLCTERVCFYHVGPGMDAKFTRLLAPDTGKFDQPVPDRFFDQDITELFGGDE